MGRGLLRRTDQSGSRYLPSSGSDIRSSATQKCILPPSFRHDLCVFYGFNTGAMLFRRIALAAVGGFEESYRWGEEWDDLVRIAQLIPIGYLPDSHIPLHLQDFWSITSTKSPGHLQPLRVCSGRGGTEYRDSLPRTERLFARLSEIGASVAAHLYLENRRDARNALKHSLSSLLCRPSIWGIRSSIRSSLLLALQYGTLFIDRPDGQEWIA